MFGDRLFLALLLAQAPIVALLLILVAKSTDLQPPPAEVIAQAGVFGIPAAMLATALPLMLAASATWFGAINSAREIVKELPILQRERLAGLRTVPYLASKFLVLLAICLFQTTVLIAIISLKVDLPSSGVLMWGPLELWISLSLAAAAALGLVRKCRSSADSRADHPHPAVDLRWGAGDGDGRPVAIVPDGHALVCGGDEGDGRDSLQHGCNWIRSGRFAAPLGCFSGHDGRAAVTGSLAYLAPAQWVIAALARTRTMGITQGPLR